MQGRGRKTSMKYVWRVIFLWLCVCGSAISVKAEDTKTYRSEDEKWDYIILDEQDKTVEIVAAYDKAVSSGGVVVPSHIEDYKVLGIGAEVFKGNESITFVTFEEGIQYIGCGCFWACTSLENVTFPDTLQRIEFDAFTSCIELEQVDIPAAVEEIGPAAFWYTPWLNNARENSEDHLVICNNILIDGRMATGEVVVPDTVTAIVGGSFYGPDSILVEDEDPKNNSTKGASLQSVTIPGSVKEIGERAFYACNQLVKVEMKEGVEAVGRNSFAQCTSLAEISIPTSLHTFGAYAFWYTPWLVSVRNEREDHLVIRNNVVLDGALTTGEIVIPEGVCEIVPYCFYAPSGTGTSFSKSEVCKIIIPDSVVSIGFGAFAYCYDLVEVRMPANLTQLNDYCFIGCKDLASITIPDSVKQIGNKVFVNCTKLKKIVLPEGIQKITGMFVNDTDDVTIVIPEKVTDISSLGLLQYKKLFLFVVADGSVENYLQENHFTHYTTYESSTSKPVDPDSESDKQPEPENPESDATGKGTEQTTEQKNTTQQENKNRVEYTVKGCQYTVLDGKNITFSGVQDSSAEKLTIPAYVKVDGVSYKVTRIDDGACKGMTNLKSVTIGNSITKIGRQAFMSCKNLKKVQIGKNVTSIEKQAFYGNKKLKQVVIKSTKLKKIGKKAFSGISKTTKFKVPRGKGDSYKKMIQKSGR